MPKIIMYWDVINLSNPPGLTFLMSDGSVVYGYAERGELPEETRPHPMPSVIVGYHPRTGKFGYPFGEWRLISEWLNQNEKIALATKEIKT